MFNKETTESLNTASLSLIIRLLLETKYRRLPVVDGDGKLVRTCHVISLYARLSFLFPLLFHVNLYTK